MTDRERLVALGYCEAACRREALIAWCIAQVAHAEGDAWARRARLVRESILHGVQEGRETTRQRRAAAQSEEVTP